MAGTVTLRGEETIKVKLTSLATMAQTRELLTGIGMRGVRSVQRGIREQRSPDGSKYKPVSRFGKNGQRLRDTGRLMNSIDFTVTFGLNSSKVTIGTNVKYGQLQHYGDKNHHASHAKMLAIPLTRQVARAVDTAGFRSAFPDAFVFKSKAGNLFLVRRDGGKLDFLAILKESVKIEGTHFLGISARGRDEITSYAAAFAKRLVERGR